MTDLKACPFCGEIPDTFPKDPKTEGNAWGEVRCVTPSCLVQPSVTDHEEAADNRGTAEYINCAARIWNTRQTEARIAELERALRPFADIAEELEDAGPDEFALVDVHMGQGKVATNGDFRQAAATLKGEGNA